MHTDKPTKDIEAILPSILENIKDKSSTDYNLVSKIKNDVSLEIKGTDDYFQRLWLQFAWDCLFGKNYYRVPQEVCDRIQDIKKQPYKVFYYDDLGILCGTAGFVLIDSVSLEIIYIVSIIKS